MGDYLRSTRACTLDSLAPPLADALRAHADQYQLGDLSAPGVACWETVSTKKKKGLFGGKPEVIVTGIVLAPPRLLWAAGKPGEKPAVLSARLRDVQVQDYVKSSMHKLVADTGLNISGLLTDSSSAGTAFIGLGPEPAAQVFRAALAEAAARA
jgi:hypothetical protein